MSQAKACRNLILCMVIFGTVGIFRRYIPLNSSLIAFVRGLVGALFLLGVMALRRRGFDRAAVGKNLWKLLVSGALIGINWILLFEAYRFTSVAVATVTVV